jgi:hypothetical protein
MKHFEESYYEILRDLRRDKESSEMDLRLLKAMKPGLRQFWKKGFDAGQTPEAAQIVTEGLYCVFCGEPKSLCPCP